MNTDTHCNAYTHAPTHTHEHTVHAFIHECTCAHMCVHMHMLLCHMFVFIVTLCFNLTTVSLGRLVLAGPSSILFSPGPEAEVSSGTQWKISEHTEQSGGRALVLALPLPFCGTVDWSLPFPEAQSSMGVDWLKQDPHGPGGSRLHAWGGDIGSLVYDSPLQSAQLPDLAYLWCF